MNSKIKIYNADCVKGAIRYLKDESVDLIICDPPFGIKEGNFKSKYNRSSKNIIPGYVEAPNDYYKFSYEWLEQAKRILKPDGSLFIVTGWSKILDIFNAIHELDLYLFDEIIWKFNFGVFTKRKFVSSHYTILHVIKSKDADFTYNRNCRYSDSELADDGKFKLGDLDRDNLWVINKEFHRGKKKNINKLPDALIKKIIQYYSNSGDSVADFFMGNFTTASVALKLGRTPSGFELNKNAFKHFMPELKKIKFGCDL